MDTLTFHQALTQAEAQARSTLDVALHERLSAAVALVKTGRTFQSNDGTWLVESTSQAGRVYSVNGVCACEDHHYNHPPQGLCKHRIAMFLSQRVRTLMQQPPAPVVPELVEPWGDNDFELAPAPEGARAPAPPAVLPEAMFSLTLKGRLVDGCEDAMLTVRAWSLAEFQAHLAAVRGLIVTPASPPADTQGPDQLSPQQHNAAAMHRPVSGFCAVHNVQMHRNTGKDGRTWYSHRLPKGGFCKGK